MDIVITTVLLISVLLTLVATDSFDNPIVYLSNGAVQGEKITGERGNLIYSFRGIPFAEPPIGKLRFKPRITKKPWKNVLRANKNGPYCPQIINSSYEGNENCLYLNVYTPKPPIKNNMSVVYYIHGGGFLNESSFMYGPKRFQLDDIILVTASYRLGTLGFLSTNDSAARGNYGLLDQTEGLKWVRDNIHYFGGDPNRVTIVLEVLVSFIKCYHPYRKVGGLQLLTATPTLDNYFLHDLPLNIIQQRNHHIKVPLIIGTTRDEGNCWFLGRISEKNFTEEQIEIILKATVEALPNADKKIKLIKEKYFGNLS